MEFPEFPLSRAFIAIAIYKGITGERTRVEKQMLGGGLRALYR